MARDSSVGVVSAPWATLNEKRQRATVNGNIVQSAEDPQFKLKASVFYGSRVPLSGFAMSGFAVSGFAMFGFAMSGFALKLWCAVDTTKTTMRFKSRRVRAMSGFDFKVCGVVDTTKTTMQKQQTSVV